MCVGRCKRLFCCLSGGGGTRAPYSSSPLRTIGPAQSAGRVWLEGVAERGVLVEQGKKREKKEFSVLKTGVAERRRPRVSKERTKQANEGFVRKSAV